MVMDASNTTAIAFMVRFDIVAFPVILEQVADHIPVESGGVC